jgi:hypothetical protein
VRLGRLYAYSPSGSVFRAGGTGGVGEVHIRSGRGVEHTGRQRGRAEGRNWITSSSSQGSPQYSADGGKVAFVSTRSGSAEIWVSDADNSNPVRLTNVGGYRVGTPRWSPDGKHIAFDSRVSGNPDIFVVPVRGGEPRQLTNASTQEMVPSWSRDARWIYFCSDRTGQLQIWKMPAEGGAPSQVTKGGGFEGFESADSQWFYYTQRKARRASAQKAQGRRTLYFHLFERVANNRNVTFRAESCETVAQEIKRPYHDTSEQDRRSAPRSSSRPAELTRTCAAKWSRCSTAALTRRVSSNLTTEGGSSIRRARALASSSQTQRQSTPFR